jgi:uncharacterized lipoprotein YajG
MKHTLITLAATAILAGCAYQHVTTESIPTLPDKDLCGYYRASEGHA